MIDRKKRILEEIDSVIDNGNELRIQLVGKGISEEKVEKLISEQIDGILEGKVWNYLVGDE